MKFIRNVKPEAIVIKRHIHILYKAAGTI